MADPEESRPFLEPPSEHQQEHESDDSTSQQAAADDDNDTQTQGSAPSAVSRRLYVSHFLSTGNSRLFEFGSVLYLATIFPGTLLPMSVYAVARGLSAIFLSSALGQYIDTGNRLQIVRLSIVLQRVAVAASCVIFFALSHGWVSSRSGRIGSLVGVTALACIEKIASIMNLVSVERDWVVVICQNDQKALRTMNSQMRRIDLVCKLLGPFLIAMIDGISTEVAILVNFGINVASISIEYLFIAQIYHSLPQLHTRGQQLSVPEHPSEAEEDQPRRAVVLSERAVAATRKVVQDMKLYFTHAAFMPSFAGALLYLTVLSFSGQMVTYLLSTGYTSSQVAVARTLSVGFEVTATWVGPWLMGRIGPIRAGLWFSSWQSVSLLIGMAVFWAFRDRSSIISASGLVGGTILSRLGLWGFDLCTQIIIQEDVEEENRGAFATTEQSWQSAFELCSYVSTIILSSPTQFEYPATISVLAVASAWILFSRFVTKRRGHLLHWPSCIPEKGQVSRERLLAASPRRSLING